MTRLHPRLLVECDPRYPIVMVLPYAIPVEVAYPYLGQDVVIVRPEPIPMMDVPTVDHAPRNRHEQRRQAAIQRRFNQGGER